MARYDFNVDTSPMAAKIKDVSSNVNGVSGAVVAMQTAVVKAENEATDFLCNNVNEGFYQLVMSQIAQKCAAANSETQAYALELTQQSKALSALKGRMNKDFHMIASRYNSLFHSLNQALHNRIFELDKPTMNFVTKDIRCSVNRVNRLIASVPVNQSESLTVSQHIAAGQIKHNAHKLIQNLASYLKAFNFQRYQCNRVKVDNSVEKPVRLHVPSILTVTSNERIAREVNVYTPRTLDSQMENALEAPLKQQIANQTETYHWVEIDSKEHALVTGEFNQHLAHAEVSERVADVIRKLYQQSKWQIIREG